MLHCIRMSQIRYIYRVLQLTSYDPTNIAGEHHILRFFDGVFTFFFRVLETGRLDQKIALIVVCKKSRVEHVRLISLSLDLRIS